MYSASPGQSITITESGIPTGSVVGVQVVKAATGSVAVARTTVGVVEVPAGSGNYVYSFVAPVEGDLYLVVLDWNSGAIVPELSKIVDLTITTTVQPGSSGVGAVGDYAKMHLGGETWAALSGSPEFGETFIQRAIETIKRRVLSPALAVSDEGLLDPRIQNYLGLLSALQLIPAARDYWANQHIQITRGDDRSEIVTYANRAQLMDAKYTDLMRLLPAIQADAETVIDTPPTIRTTGPKIDEYDDCRVTADPRNFPSYDSYPGGPLRATGSVWR